MKKVLAAFLAIALMLSPAGNFVFQDGSPTVEAKRYKSGKGGFNLNQNKNNSLFQNKNTTTNKSATTATKKAFKPSGLMKGIMLGGLAGLLFGSLFANMGILGAMLGLLVNVLAVIILISIIRRIYVFYKGKKKKEDPNPWRS